MDDLARFCCLNPACRLHGVRDAQNLYVRDRYGKDKAKRLLCCKACGARFSETKGTPLFGSKLPSDTRLSVLEHLGEGCGVRQTARLTKVNLKSVARLARKAGGHAKALHDELVAFSPRTAEVQFDEKWSFVAKKQERWDAAAADPADAERGESWDHVAFDPEHRLVVAVVPGKRTAENCRALVQEFRRRTRGRVMRLMTSDEYPSYKVAIQQVYGLRSVPLTVLPRPKGRPRVPKRRVPEWLTYAMVHKHRVDGRVVKVTLETVFGSDASVAAALARSSVSNVVNTSFVERHNGTDRHRNARKARRTYRFSKDWAIHNGMTYFTMYSYNFCWPVRTLAEIDPAGRRRQRTPAMAAGLADHVWSLREWVTLPARQ